MSEVYVCIEKVNLGFSAIVSSSFCFLFEGCGRRVDWSERKMAACFAVVYRHDVRGLRQPCSTYMAVQVRAYLVCITSLAWSTRLVSTRVFANGICAKGGKYALYGF